VEGVEEVERGERERRVVRVSWVSSCWAMPMG
jgi:hypothetical protein